MSDVNADAGTAVPGATTAGMADHEVEDRARKLGWRPQDQWRGKPDEFKDARSFMDTAFSNPAVLYQNYETLDRRYGRLEREHQATRAKMEEAVGMIGEMTDQFRSVREQTYKRARADIDRERTQAVASGDTAEFQRLDAELQQIDASKPAPAPAKAAAAAAVTPPAPPTEVQEWGQRNPWFYTDPLLQQTAQSLHVALLNAEPGLSLSDNLAAVERRVKAAFPEKFPAPVRAAAASDGGDQERAAAVETPTGQGRQPGNRNSRSFTNLPRESKAAFAKYAKMLEGKGKPLTEKEWADNYYEQFPEESA